MIQAGYTVETVQDVLGDIARVNGLTESEVVVFPNALLVSARGPGAASHRRGGERRRASFCSRRSTRSSGRWTPPARAC